MKRWSEQRSQNSQESEVSSNDALSEKRGDLLCQIQMLLVDEVK